MKISDNPFDLLKESIQKDSDYAHSWHCNIAMAFYDEGGTHEMSNRAATRFMKNAFDVETGNK